MYKVLLSVFLLPYTVSALAAGVRPPNSATFLKSNAPENQLITIDANKTIKRYPSFSRLTEMNVMTLNGRSPINPNYFIYNTVVHFMVYVTKGEGVFYVDDAVIHASEGDVLDVPPKTRFAASGHGFEYVTVENPAFFSAQSYIVNSQGFVVGNN